MQVVEAAEDLEVTRTHRIAMPNSRRRHTKATSIRDDRGGAERLALLINGGMSDAAIFDSCVCTRDLFRRFPTNDPHVGPRP